MLLLPIKTIPVIFDSSLFTVYESSVVLLLSNIVFYIMIIAFTTILIKALSRIIRIL